MKKIFALILTSTLLISTVACSSDEPTIIFQASGSESSSTFTGGENVVAPYLDHLGTPSWVYNSYNRQIFTSTLFISADYGNIYSAPLDGSTKELSLLVEGDRTVQYTSPMIYGDEVYAIKYDVTGTSPSQFVSVYTPEGTAPTFQDITFSTNNISLPALIGDHLYYIHLETNFIIKKDLKNAQESKIYTKDGYKTDRLVYDGNYLYFQLTYSEEVQEDTAHALKTLHRVNVEDFNTLESFDLGKSYYLDFVNNGEIYLYPWLSTQDPSANFVVGNVVKTTWNSTITPFFSSPKEEQEVLYFQPYEDGYLVSSMNKKGSIYYFSFYDQDGNYVKDLLDPVTLQTDGYSFFPTMNSFGKALLYTNQIHNLKNEKFEVSTTLILGDGKQISIPTPPVTG